MFMEVEVHKRGKDLWVILPKKLVRDMHVKEHQKVFIEIITEEESIMRDPEMRASIEEAEEAKRKGIKPWRLPQP